MLGNFKRQVTGAHAVLFRRRPAAARSKPARSKPARPSRLAFEPLEARLVLDGGSLVMSEFLAVNDRVLADADGDFSDWIEIHNPTETAVELDGWYLTDDAGDPTKWQLPNLTPDPEITLAPGGYLVVFASAKDRTDPAELHTSFQLNGEGEYLALVEPDGTTVAHQFAPEFPEQFEDVSYGMRLDGDFFEETLVEEYAAATALVPADDSLGLSWTQVGFDDSAWLSGTTGVGYERGSGYQDLIYIDVESQMYNLRPGVYARVDFHVDDLTDVNSLKLSMKYDDGFVAYVNGQRVAAARAPANPTADSTATSNHADSEAVIFEEFEITDYLGALQVGTNVLAIHGLNSSTGSSDMLILPKLEVGGVHGTITLVPGYFPVPTPGGPNTTGYSGFVEDTRFSVDRGFFDWPFPVEITTETAGATIRYTTDGSQPTETNGTTYTAPVTIDTTTTLRAAAFKEDCRPTNVDTQTYIFLDDVIRQPDDPAGFPATWNGHPAEYGMDPDVVNDPRYSSTIEDDLKSIPTMSLVMEVDDVFGPTGIYSNPRNSGLAWERPGSVELIYPDGSPGVQVNCGTRIYGGVGRYEQFEKHTFRLLFKSDYGPTKLRYPLFGEDATDAFDTIILRAGFNNAWHRHNGFEENQAQFIRDEWIRQSQLDMGRAGLHGTFVHLYVNGLYWGLYNPVERANADFGSSYFGGEKEEWDALNSYPRNIVDGNADAWIAAQNLAEADPVDVSAIDQYVDIPNLIDYMILNFYAGNQDWDDHNWYAVNRQTEGPGYKFLGWDSERTLESITGSNRTGIHQYNKPSNLYAGLRTDPEFRMLFADQAHRHLFNGGALTPEDTRARYQALADFIDRAIVGESARWGDSSRPDDPYTRDDEWVAERDRLLNQYFPQRTDVALGFLRGAGLYPYTDAPSFNRHGGQVDPGFELTMGAPSGTIYYTLDGSDPRLPGGGVSPAADVFISDVTTEDLIAIDDEWAYEQSGNDLGTSWRDAAFDDSAWPRGDALLYVEGSALPAPKNTPLTLGQTTYYFRKHFTFDGDLQDTTFQLRTVIDDGAIVYLNGQEVRRLGMPAGGVNHQTLASRTVGNAVFEGPFPIPADALVQGENVIAVEVHQCNTGSSDVVLGLELESVTQTTTTPLPLTESTLVKSRALDGSEWSALNEALFIVHEPATAENLAITEINYNPFDPTTAELAVDPNFENNHFEFVELQNTSDDTIDLSGVQFTEGIRFDFTGSSVDVLAPGEYVVVASNAAAFQARYGTGISLAGEYTGRLDNGGERTELLDWTGEAIHNFDYNDTGNWPGRADGKGASLELISPDDVPEDEPQRTAYLEDGDNWRSSSEYGGSPGSLGAGLLGDVVVNEVLSHTDDLLSDSIELYNTTGSPIDVGGWYLSDDWGWDPTGEDGNYKKYRIPNGTSIPALGYLVFDERDFNPTWDDPQADPGPNDFALNGAHGDDVWLMEADAGGKLTRFVDHVDFDAAAQGESWGRWPNGSGDLYPMLTPTLDPQDGENSGPRVGPVIFSEVHYNPRLIDPDNDLEFVEIYNSTNQAVDLTEWRIRGGIDYDFPAGTMLDASSALVVLPFELSDADKWSAFCTEYRLEVQETDGFLGGYTGQLNDDGERIELQRPDDPPDDEPLFIPRLLEDEVRYDDDQPWPTDADGGGDSLSRNEIDAWGNTYLSWDPLLPSPGQTEFVPVEDAEVVGRYIFYNHSAFDGESSAADVRDDDAIATDKEALLPGGTATLANYTSYSSGINGIMIDVDGMAEFAEPGVDDFQFRVGNSDTPGSWAAGPSPSLIAVRPGAGVDGSDRITLIWPDNAIGKQWLQVTVLTTDTTRLPEEDVFYFGNAIGDSGNSTTDAKVNATDVLAARNHQRTFINPAPIDFNFDYDRDARVNATDMLIARNNQTNFLTALNLITVPGSEAAAGAAAHDAVWSQTVGRDSACRESSFGKPDWLYEFDQTSPKKMVFLCFSDFSKMADGNSGPVV